MKGKSRRLGMKLYIVLILMFFGITGCDETPQMETQTIETENEVQVLQQDTEEDAEEIIDICLDLYKKENDTFGRQL